MVIVNGIFLLGNKKMNKYKEEFEKKLIDIETATFDYEKARYNEATNKYANNKTEENLSFFAQTKSELDKVFSHFERIKSAIKSSEQNDVNLSED